MKMVAFIVAVMAAVVSVSVGVRSIRLSKTAKRLEKAIKDVVRDEAIKEVREVSRISSQFAGNRMRAEEDFTGYSAYVKFDAFEFLELIYQVQEETRKAIEKEGEGTTK